MNDINIEIVENGVILKTTKETKGEHGVDYKHETMVFPSLEEAQEWLSRNAPKKKIKDGKIMDMMDET